MSEVDLSNKVLPRDIVISFWNGFWMAVIMQLTPQVT